MSDIKMSFDAEVAKEVGTDAAIILSNIEFWQATNKANKRNFKDGRYWTYNTIEAYTELFSYLTYAQIRRCLEKLEQSEYILSGNYNQSTYDRTKWYCSKRQIHLSELANGTVRNNETIPYNKPDSKPYLKIKMSEIKISDVPLEFQEHFEIAEAFRNLFIKNLKQAGASTKHQDNATFKSYADQVRLMFESDNATKEQFIKVFRFLDSTDGNFWKANILSIKSLREKFDRLIMDAGKAKPSASRKREEVVTQNSNWENIT